MGNNRKRYIILLSLLIIMFSLFSGAFSLFTDYKVKAVRAKSGVALELEMDNGILSVEQVGHVVFKDGVGWYYKDTYAEISAECKDGYSFTGWYNGEQKVSDNSVEEYLVSEHVVLFAKSETITYSVSFEVDGGTVPEGADNEYTVEDNMSLPIPSKDGYMFDGWYEDPDFSGESVTSTEGTIGNKTYYVKWIPIEYEITYEVNGGTLPEDVDTSYTVEDNVTLPTPTREGYDFMGWYEEDDFSGEPATVIPKGTIGNNTYYAKWKEKEPVAFAVYSEDDMSLLFYKRIIVPKVGDTFDGRTVTAVYTGIEELDATNEKEIPWKNKRTYPTRVEVVDEIKPINTAYWFYWFGACQTMDLTKLNTSEVTDMSYMFYSAGYQADTIKYNMSGWDVSNVENMKNMFNKAGYYADTIEFIGLETWDVSNVENMNCLFSWAGENADDVKLDISGWDTSSVTDMGAMFHYAFTYSPFWDAQDFSSKTITRDDGSTYVAWDVSNVTKMHQMFGGVSCSSATGYNFKLNLSGWDVSNVENMKNMFYESGQTRNNLFELNLSNWKLSSVTDINGMSLSIPDDRYGAVNIKYDMSGWDVSNVADMSYWFQDLGGYASVLELIGLETWDVSNVENMSGLFYGSGASETWNVGDLSGWDVSNVENMNSMFYDSGASETWNVGDLGNWNTANVIDMGSMFYGVGVIPDSNWSMEFTWNVGDLSSWDVSNVENMNSMFYRTGYNAATFDIGNIGNWNVSNVTDMSFMFYQAGYNVNTFEIGDLDNWDVSNVENMNSMFYEIGRKEFDIGDIGNWNVANVTNMNSMFCRTGKYGFNVGDLSRWDTSSVTDMGRMFSSAAGNSDSANDATFDIGDIGNWDVSNVENMNSMFSGVGRYGFNVGDLSRWDTSSVTDMGSMFNNAGYEADTFVLDLSTKTITKDDGSTYTAWDVSNVGNMSRMFYQAGYKATTWNIGDLSNWDVSGVTNMSYMFYYAGYKADYSLDLTGWNVSNVTEYEFCNSGVASKITAPNFGATASLSLETAEEIDNEVETDAYWQDIVNRMLNGETEITLDASVTEMPMELIDAVSYLEAPVTFTWNEQTFILTQESINDYEYVSGGTVPMTEVIAKSLNEQDAEEPEVSDETTNLEALETTVEGSVDLSAEKGDMDSVEGALDSSTAVDGDVEEIPEVTEEQNGETMEESDEDSSKDSEQEDVLTMSNSDEEVTEDTSSGTISEESDNSESISEDGVADKTDSIAYGDAA